jgi:hypothetical protein
VPAPHELTLNSAAGSALTSFLQRHPETKIKRKHSCKSENRGKIKKLPDGRRSVRKNIVPEALKFWGARPDEAIFL